MTADPKVLAACNASIGELIDQMRDGLHNGAPIREQIPLIRQLADQYDLAGMHDTAGKFRSNADALIPLRDYMDRNEAVAQHRAERRRKWLRILTLGLRHNNLKVTTAPRPDRESAR